MQKKLIILLTFLFMFMFTPIFRGEDAFSHHNKIKIKLFHSPTCKHCIEIKQKFLPQIIAKYKDKIDIEYLDVNKKDNFKQFLATERQFGAKPRVPAMLVGTHFLVGVQSIEQNLEPLLKKYIFENAVPEVRIGKVNLLEKFRSFSALAVIAAGLIDGINPCAFTVLIFFISFLTLMGYKKKDLFTIGFTFIFAVFLTYLALGLGLFKGLYELKHFYLLLKAAYVGLASLCFAMAYLNLKDFLVYQKTKNPDFLKVKIPKPVRLKINSIITKFYRKDSSSKHQTVVSLVLGTFLVGFLVSLLEAVCTGQVYLPTIVFILKEPALRLRAVFYLLLYNLMFVFPLFLILFLAVLGTSSRKLEEFFRKRIALVKIFMFILFLGLGLFLLIGI